MEFQGNAHATGHLGLTVLRGGKELMPEYPWPAEQLSMDQVTRYGFPRRGLSDEVNEWRASNVRRLINPTRKILKAMRQQRHGAPIIPVHGRLWLTVFRDGEPIPLGLASLRLVTTAGVTFIATRMFDAATTIGGFDFHGFGTGVTAEAIGDTALVTEETTQYNPDSTRPTGTPTNPSANVYRTVGTYSPDSGTNPRPITEHGIFSQAATGGGTLLDRSLFSVVNLVPAADSLQATYDFTLPAGG
jgi:hypothetical protein